MSWGKNALGGDWATGEGFVRCCDQDGLHLHGAGEILPPLADARERAGLQVAHLMRRRLLAHKSSRPEGEDYWQVPDADHMCFMALQVVDALVGRPSRAHKMTYRIGYWMLERRLSGGFRSRVIPRHINPWGLALAVTFFGAMLGYALLEGRLKVAFE